MDTEPQKRQTSRLLIDEPPLVIQPSLACAVGLNEALILQQVHYWMSKPEMGKTLEGRRWVRITHEDWLDQLPFLGVDALRRAIKNVKDKNVLLYSRKLSDTAWDRSTWYSIDYAVLDAIELPARETAAQKRKKKNGNGAKHDAVPSSGNLTLHDEVSASSNVSKPELPTSGDLTISYTETTSENTPKTEETLPDGKVPTVASAPVETEIPAKIAELYTTLEPLAEKSEEPPNSAAPPEPHPPGQYALVDGVLTGPFRNYNAARTFAPTGTITQTPPRDVVAVPPAKPGRKPKADKPRLEQPPAEVKDAIAKLCYGGNEVIGANWARIVKTWNKLERPDVEKVDKFSRWWYACHWIGQKKQPPKPEQMVSEWDVAMNWDGATVTRSSGYQTTTERNDDILKRSYERMMREKAAKEAKGGK